MPGPIPDQCDADDNATIEHPSGQLQLRNSTINNAVTGFYNVQTDGDFLYNAANTSAFNNAGTIDKTAGTGSSTSRDAVRQRAGWHREG